MGAERAGGVPASDDPHGGHATHGGHSHAHGPAAPVSRRLRVVVAAVLVPFAAAVVVGLAVLWPGPLPHHARTGIGFDQQVRQGKVLSVEELPCAKLGAAGQQSDGSPTAEPTSGGVCRRTKIEVTDGKDKGRTFFDIEHPDQTRRYSVGEGVVLSYSPKAPKSLQYSITDVDRGLPMGVLAGVFALAVVVVGRWRGLAALVALVISFALLTLFILPAILHGSDPLLVAVVGASAIMLIALYLCHGLSARTSVAVLGTLCSLVLIGALGEVFASWAQLTGNTSDETGLVHDLYPHIEIRGLLLAGFIIGSLGVLDDVTVTQTSAVWELKQADPGLGARALYRAGIRIGRDHIASTVNTLVLAYAGASLPLLLLFSIAQRNITGVATSEVVAEEIARTLVGSIGLVASVPLTTALAALMAAADHPAASTASVAPAVSGHRRHGRRKR
jgi:uncharacterized membrane protein